jgi:PAS domain-containing protein
MSGKKSNQAAKEIYRQLEMYQLIFDSIYNGAIVTDSDGYVTHLNKPYGRFLGRASHMIIHIL